MKLHYSKILLLYLPLNILVSSSYVHNKNKAYITTRHIPTNTSRVLSECDIDTSIYDNDPEMRSVKENFNRQTSRRFEEYDERMKGKRQKCKEQCDKDVQQIILKDKIQKSLEEKIEKCCLRCGCGLGGVAAGVGLFGALAVKELTRAATDAAIEFSSKKGIEAGIQAVIMEIKKLSFISKLSSIDWSKLIKASNYNTLSGLVEASKDAVTTTGETCPAIGKSIDQVCNALTEAENWFGPVLTAAKDTTESTTASVKVIELGKVAAESTHLYSSIGYSVIAILIIVFGYGNHLFNFTLS
ncbi:PIR protein, putative [Plasmodium sp. gorilla clade G1]|nr:PIR protein, putative [Plasmodium sp. gorilla clade G1]